MPAPLSDAELVEQVRSRYAAVALQVTAAGCCSGPAAAAASSSCCDGGTGPGIVGLSSGPFGAGLYAPEQVQVLPEAAYLASLGCGNPTAVADLHPGERVLDLGSGGGIDVLLSARRVGPTGYVYGVDMTAQMLELARANATEAGATNVEFRAGRIEDVPLPDASVDVVISNCVINLSVDKPAVLREIARVLVPGGRLGISDVVAEDRLSAADRAALGDYASCAAGALSRAAYLAGLADAGFVDAEVTFTHEVEAGSGLHGAIIRARTPTA